MEEKFIISDENLIMRILYEQYIFMEEIEVWIEQNIYRTHIVDGNDIDDVDEMAHDNVDSNKTSFKLQWVSLIKKTSYFFLDRFSPDIDFIKVKPGMNILLKIFLGFQAMETVVPIIELIDKEKSFIVKIGFPRELKVIHTRNYLRAYALPDTHLRVTIYSEIFKYHNPKLSNLSESGISFFTNLPPDSLLVGENVTIKVGIYDWSENLLFNGVIRHYTELSDKECCEISKNHPEFKDIKAMVGVEFININDTQRKHMAEIGYFLQRENLLKEKEGLLDLNKQLKIKVQQQTNLLREKDIKLLEMDRVTEILTLASGIAHEINNPLSFVKSTVYFIQKGVSKFVLLSKFWDDKPLEKSIQDEYKSLQEKMNYDYLVKSVDDKFGAIEKGISRISSIVTTLKNFSRVDMDDFGLVNLNESIEAAIGFMKKDIHHNIEIITELNELPMILCSGRDIHQCLLSTIKNAIDAVDKVGIIKISSNYRESENEVDIVINDNGVGMTPEVLKKAFNPFFTTKPVGSGIGIGLSMVDRIIKRHGGNIYMSSEQGFGTTLTLRIPVKSTSEIYKDINLAKK